MKEKLLVCIVLLMLGCVGTTAAKSGTLNNEAASADSARAEKRFPRISLERLPYKNLQESSKWSKLMNGRALTISLRKKKAHGSSQGQDYCLGCDTDSMFGNDGDNAGFESYDGVGNPNARGGGACGWSCCFKQCMNSAMSGTGQLCTTNCAACGFAPNPWSCAVCAACGTVGFVAIEFCALHCCVNPGC